MASLKKQQIKKEIETFLIDYPNLAIIKLDKTNHPTLEQLRKQLKTVGAKFKVVKNTIFQKALYQLASKNKQINSLKEKTAIFLKENTALLGLSENWSRGLNTFYQFIQKEKTLSFKIGILDKTLYLSNDLLKIAQLPAKEVLISKIIGSFKSPISRTVYVMKFNISKLTYILKAKSQKA